MSLQKHLLEKLQKLEDSTNEAMANLTGEPVGDLKEYRFSIQSPELSEGVINKTIFKRNAKEVRKEIFTLCEFYSLKNVKINYKKV